MKVQLQSLSIENFLSYKQSITIQLADRGCVLLAGQNTASSTLDANGVGKTALAEALYWVLFGKTLRKIPADSVIYNGASECKVTVKFMLDGTIHSLTRTRNGKTSAVALVRPSGTITGMSEVAEFVSGTLRITENIFANFIYLGRGDGRRLPFHLMTDADRKSLIATCRPELELFPQILASINNELRDIDTQRSKTTIEMAGISAVIVQSDQDLVMNQKQLADLRGRLSERKRAEAVLASELRNTKTTCESGKVAIEKKITALQDTLSGKRSSRVERLEQKRKHNLNRFKEALQITRSSIQQLRRQLGDLTSNQACPTCKRPYEGADFSKDVARLTESARQYTALSTRYEEIIKRTEASLQRYDVRKYKQQLAEKLDPYRRQLEALDKMLAAKQQEAYECSRTVAMLDKQVLEKTEQIDSLHARLRENRRKLESLQAGISGLEYQEEVLHIESKLAALSGIPALIVDDVLVDVEKYANKIMADLSGGEIVVRMGVEGGEVGKRWGSITSTATNSLGAVEYGGNSSGERARVDVAILLALNMALGNRLGLDIPFLFIDEVLDGLDASGVGAVVNVLKEHILPIKKTIFVASHNMALRELFDSVIMVSKGNEGTVIHD